MDAWTITIIGPDMITGLFPCVVGRREPALRPEPHRSLAPNPANFRVPPYRKNPTPNPPKFETWPARWTETDGTVY